jgi:type I restriction enzyme S subunit
MNAQQLKNAILQEAIEGRLVPQDPNDEPASVLLARIRKEKEQLVKEGKLKKKDLEVKPISEDEIPFEIPESWEWVKITSILLLLTDGTHNSPPSFPSGDYLYITAKNIKSDGIDLTNVSYVSKKIHDEIYSRCNPEYGDILYIKDGATAGVVTINNLKEPFSLLSSVALLKQSREMDSRYLLAYFNSPYCYNTVRSSMKGAAITRITLRMIQEWLIPVPPIEEQRRIAEKVDLLLPKIKEYGKAQDALNKLNAELPERLKKSILQEAIEGRLVPQDPNDEPASVLLDKIRQEKAQLVKAGKLKKKDLIETPISEDEIPFEIPDSWEWAKLGDVTEIARGGSPRPIKEYLTNAPNGLNWIKIGDTDKGGKYINSCKEKIKPEGLKKTRMVHPGDFLLTNSMSFGRPYITNIEGCIHDGWLMISPYAGVFDQSFLFYVLSSAFAHKQFNDKVAGAVVQNLNSDKVADSIIPLPPLAEQHRIVKKLEQLLGKIELMNK